MFFFKKDSSLSRCTSIFIINKFIVSVFLSQYFLASEISISPYAFRLRTRELAELAEHDNYDNVTESKLTDHNSDLEDSPDHDFDSGHDYDSDVNSSIIHVKPVAVTVDLQKKSSDFQEPSNLVVNDTTVTNATLSINLNEVGTKAIITESQGLIKCNSTSNTEPLPTSKSEISHSDVTTTLIDNNDQKRSDQIQKTFNASSIIHQHEHQHEHEQSFALVNVSNDANDPHNRRRDGTYHRDPLFYGQGKRWQRNQDQVKKDYEKNNTKAKFWNPFTWPMPIRLACLCCCCGLVCVCLSRYNKRDNGEVETNEYAW